MMTTYSLTCGCTDLMRCMLHQQMIDEKMFGKLNIVPFDNKPNGIKVNLFEPRIEKMTVKAHKPFDPSVDYGLELRNDEIKEIDGRQFVFLKGLERLAKERGIVSAICKRLDAVSEKFVICTYQYTFVDGSVYEGSADATVSNCDGDFRLYLSAMAESRAKARALRVAFGVTLCSVEEKAEVSYVEDSNAAIEDAQAVVIRQIAKRKGLGWTEVAGMVKGKRPEKIEDLTKVQAKDIIAQLNELKSKK